MSTTSPIPEPTLNIAKLGACENCGRLNKLVKGNCGPCRGVMGYFFRPAGMVPTAGTKAPNK